jgi:hypothetical protein
MTLLAALLLSQTKPLTGEQAIDKMKAAVRAAVPITGSAVISGASGSVGLTFKFMYPHMVYEMIDYGGGTKTELHWSGGPIYSFYGAKGYSADKAPASGDPIHLGLIGFENGFADSNLYRNIGSCVSERFQSQRAYMVAVTLSIGEHPTELLHIDAKTFLPLGCDEITGPEKAHIVYQNVETHAPLKAANFAWKPAPGTPKKG